MEKQAKILCDIVYNCVSNEHKMIVGERIHNRLRGCPDYIENRIILNVDEDNTVHLYVYEDSEFIPFVGFETKESLRLR